MNLIRNWLTSGVLVALRLSLAMWVGAAILFVVTSVAEQTSPDFDSVIRDRLATIRFPFYYAFGFGSMSVACLFAVISLFTAKGCQRKRVVAALVFASISGGIMSYDYQNVYLPLQQAITPPGQARTQEFVKLHEQSTQINIVHLSFALLAAIVASSQPRPNASESCAT